MRLYWGVRPLKGYRRDTTENIIINAMETLKENKLVAKGQLVVVTAGDPATNSSKAEIQCNQYAACNGSKIML